jgi:hypothetical protein
MKTLPPIILSNRSLAPITSHYPTTPKPSGGGSLLTVLLLALACFVPLPKAQAVSPAPDGGYPGGNTAEGQNALFSLTSGGYNTGVGLFSLRTDTTGSFNTAIGAGTLLANTADQNTATGAGALLSNTTGFVNTANGAFALFSNTEGITNAATGDSALFSNTTGNYNTADGAFALFSNTTGALNTANGYAALNRNTTGDHNTANGDGALFNNTAGDFNTANAYHALFSNITGLSNTAAGSEALANNTTGSDNTAMGAAALFSNTIGVGNTALGVGAGGGVTTASNVICIGLAGQDVGDSCFIGNIFNATSSGGTAVFINSDGKLGTILSSRRFKEEIKPMERASEALFALRPITFRYKKNIDPQGIPQFGLVAEDVEQINPDLVVRDKDGTVNTVRYEAVNAMLLNEFLKEHCRVEEQEASIRRLQSVVAKQEGTIVQQKQGMEAVTARLNEQATQIQKVSAQLDLGRPAPQQVVLKNP